MSLEKDHFDIMGERIKRQAPFLRSVLNEGSAAARRHMFRMANKDQINAISELILNTLNGNVPVSKITRHGLAPHANLLRQLGRRCASLMSRRKLLMNQSGGDFWPHLHRCYRRVCGHW